MVMVRFLAALVALLQLVECTGTAPAVAAFGEFLEFPGLIREKKKLPEPFSYLAKEHLPKKFFWGNVGGRNLLTKMVNQHVPQYCGSCWAQASVTALADRIKIARMGRGVDIALSVQYLLNCGLGTAGTCLGGSPHGAYQFITESGHIPFETCLPYEACSADSDSGICRQNNYECKDLNICRTCVPIFGTTGPQHLTRTLRSKCFAVQQFPNATIAEYGDINMNTMIYAKDGTPELIIRTDQEHRMMAEVYARGPIACTFNADGVRDYAGGIVDADYQGPIDHIVSIVGWGENATTGLKYWIVRNSWGEYWGEMGFFRLARGKNSLDIETACAWATPATWTEQNQPCEMDGTCETPGKWHNTYLDPSLNGNKAYADLLLAESYGVPAGAIASGGAGSTVKSKVEEAYEVIFT